MSMRLFIDICEGRIADEPLGKRSPGWGTPMPDTEVKPAGTAAPDHANKWLDDLRNAMIFEFQHSWHQVNGFIHANRNDLDNAQRNGADPRDVARRIHDLWIKKTRP